jgi:hypothetical protein
MKKFCDDGVFKIPRGFTGHRYEIADKKIPGRSLPAVSESHTCAHYLQPSKSRNQPSIRNFQHNCTIQTGFFQHTPARMAIRNRLIHGYAAISEDVAWGVMETSLPVLAREVKELLDNFGK